MGLTKEYLIQGIFLVIIFMCTSALCDNKVSMTRLQLASARTISARKPAKHSAEAPFILAACTLALIFYQVP